MDDFDELKECLKYENLLFHRLASKGISKYCVFAPSHVLKDRVVNRFKILNIVPLNEIKRDYRNFLVERLVDVPPIKKDEIEYLKKKLDE